MSGKACSRSTGRCGTRTDFTHDEAIRDCLASVLVSPHFCYRIDLVEAAGSGTSGSNAGSPSSRRVATVPLSDGALASRLSYFPWSSLPDDALLAHAAAGDLHRPKVLIAEARCMMADDRIRGLAVEFGGHWLDFRRFEEHNAVDRARFLPSTMSFARPCSRSRCASFRTSFSPIAR